MSNQTSVYIALLRGINVSGQKKIRMADLIQHFGELQFENIKTYIQSGNILFRYQTTDIKKLAEKIENQIKEKYGFYAPSIVITPSDLKYTLENNLFINDRNENPDRCYVTFLSELPEAEYVVKLNNYSYSPEEFILDKKIIFFYSPNSYGKAKMNNNFFEQKLKVKATTRNWKTVNKLYELVEEI